MGSGVVELHKRLVGLLELHRRGAQRELIVIQAPLHVEMRFHPIQIAFPFGTHNRLVIICKRVQTASNSVEVKAPPLSEIKDWGTP